MFREYSKYPPNSRPVDDTHSDVAEPMTIAVAPQALLQTDAAGRRLSTGVFCSLQPAYHHVSAGREQRMTLRCSRGSERGDLQEKGLPLVIGDVDADLMTNQGQFTLPLSGARFTDDGFRGDQAAGDGTYTLVLPISERRAGLVSFSAQVLLADREDGDPSDAQLLNARFLISPPPTARFTKKISERLQDGSLVVTAQLEVERAGRYRVFANLEHDGELLAYAKEDRDLEAGVQHIELLFFGKILHDAGIDGPFAVTQLRGQRFNLDADNAGPLAEPLETVTLALQTAAYRAADFSPKEWTSAYKEERIAELAALAAAETR
jgi:hypothetical protein